MSVATRHKVGWVLLALALVTAVAVPLLSDTPDQEHTFGEQEITAGPVHLIVRPTVTWMFTLQFSLPILLCGVAGLLCLIWPTRRSSS